MFPVIREVINLGTCSPCYTFTRTWIGLNLISGTDILAYDCSRMEFYFLDSAVSPKQTIFGWGLSGPGKGRSNRRWRKDHVRVKHVFVTFLRGHAERLCSTSSPYDWVSCSAAPSGLTPSRASGALRAYKACWAVSVLSIAHSDLH